MCRCLEPLGFAGLHRPYDEALIVVTGVAVVFNVPFRGVRRVVVAVLIVVAEVIHIGNGSLAVGVGCVLAHLGHVGCTADVGYCVVMSPGEVTVLDLPSKPSLQVW